MYLLSVRNVKNHGDQNPQRMMVRYAQMDIDYTFAQMLYLCVSPRKVYQLTSYRYS